MRDDPNYDALILALYPDIDKYEEEVVYKFSRNRTLLFWLFCCSASKFVQYYRNLLSVKRKEPVTKR